MDDLGPMPLDVLSLLLYLWIIGCPPVICAASFVTKIITSLARIAYPVVYFLAKVTLLSACATLLVTCLVTLLSILHHLGAPTGPDHLLVRLLQRKIRAQLWAISKEQDQVLKDIDKYATAIPEWDVASADLMAEIRLAERILVQKIRGWEPVPKRRYTQVKGHYTSWARPSRVPSGNPLNRWWNDDDDPRVFEAKTRLDYNRARLATKKRWYQRFESEHDELTKALDTVTKKKDEVEDHPDFPTWGDDFEERLLAPRRQPQTQYFDLEGERKAALRPVGFGFAEKCKGLLVHLCLDCGEQYEAHGWMYQYPSIAAAAATCKIRPCLDAQARADYWRRVLSPKPVERVLVPTNFLSSQLPRLPLSAPLFGVGCPAQHIVQPAPTPITTTYATTITTTTGLPAPPICPLTPPLRALETVRPPSPSQPSTPPACALAAVRPVSPSPSSRFALVSAVPSVPVVPDISAVLRPVAVVAAPTTSSSVPAETENEGLVTPTGSELEREFEREDQLEGTKRLEMLEKAVRETNREAEAEKEEKRKTKIRKGKQKMTRREDEDWAQEKAEEAERAARYRQRY